MRLLALNLSLTVSLAVFGLLALLLPSHAAAQGGCFTNSTGFLLSNFSVIGPGVENMCPPGWYCPNIYRNDSKTWPAVCPASAACVQQRLNYRTCAAQGLYEPVPCTKGHYCPTNREMYECPSGSYCPAGSVTPIKCNGLSSCPAGSHTDYFVGVVLVVGLVDIALVVAYFALRRYLSQPTPLSSSSVTESPAQTTARLIREALGPAQPVQISFENLAVRLSADHATAPNKSLLQGVSGSLRAGEVTAIMGPSGAGKTVLFSTVLGKTPKDWTVEGALRVCGNLTLQDFPHLVGFVPQDDVLRGDLTVAENILYSSEVRLPADWTAEQRREMRSAVVRALGIDHVRDVQIGDEETRGVSGGQRKRCSVAVELAAAPAVIFLDEPTTGLDATSALELVRLLKVVAREARIPVAMVIHQPRVEIWNELDSVLLLAPGGRTVYSGHRGGVQAHLSRLLDASLFENKGNPADIMMDLIAEHGQLLADDWQRDVEATTPLLAKTEPPLRTIASPLKQLAMAHIRGVIGSSRSAHVFLLDIFLGMLGGTLLTAAATDSALEAPFAGQLAVLSPRVDIHKPSMLMMLWGIALAAGLGPAGVRALGSKRPQYWREASSGYSRWAYYIGAQTAEIYRVLLTMLHFTAVVYLMWKPYTPFGTLYWVLIMYALCIDGQSLALGNLLPPAIAPLLATVVAVCTALFNGFPQIPGSFAFYAFGLTEMAYTFEINSVKDFYRWEQINRVWSYQRDNLTTDYINVFLWLVALRVLGYVLMVMTNRDKQR